MRNSIEVRKEIFLDHLNWESGFSTLAMGFAAVSLIFGYLIFAESMLPLNWIIPQLIVVALFFLGFNHFIHSWANLTEKQLLRRLFFVGLAIRIAIIFLLYYVFENITDSAFEPSAADSKLYHIHGIDLAKRFANGDFNVSSYLWDSGFSDFGYNVFLGAVYWIFGPSILIPRFINAIIGAWSCVLVYKIAKKTIEDEYSSRMAAIMAMLFPNLIYYTGLHLKETIMIFLVITAIHKSILFVQDKNVNFWTIFPLLFSLILLFFFRTIIAVLVLASFLFYYIYFGNGDRKYRKKILPTIFAVILLLSILYFLKYERVMNEVNFIFSNGSNKMDLELARKSARGINLKGNFAPIMLFIAALPAPFPSFVNVPGQEGNSLQFGCAFVKNILVCFSIFGIYSSFKERIKKTLIINSFTIGYTIVVAASAFATSHRFQLVTLPLLCILAGYGIQKASNKQKKIWYLYLIIMLIVVLLWNNFKLKIRGWV